MRQLSLGQRVRGELSAALLHDPEVVFLDEPTIGLDVVAKQRVRDFLVELNRERGVTVVLTTHDLGDIERLCSRLVVIDHGRVIWDGAIEELKRRYGRERTLVVDLEEPAPALEIPGARVTRVEGPRQWLSFRGDEVSAARADRCRRGAGPARRPRGRGDRDRGDRAPDLRGRRRRVGDELVPRSDDRGVGAELVEQSLERAGSRLEHRLTNTELRECDAGERLRRVGEEADPAPAREQRAKCRARRRVASQVDRRAVLAEALEEDAPVPRLSSIELGRSRTALARQVRRIDPEHPARRCEPVVPERARVPEHAVDVDRERLSREAPSPHALPKGDSDRDTDGVDQDVERRALPLRHEHLMDLIGHRVGDPDRKRRPRTPERAHEKCSEHRELGRVPDLPQHEIPAEPGPEPGDGRQREDDARPYGHRQPQTDDWAGHRPMIGSASRQGAR